MSKNNKPAQNCQQIILKRLAKIGYTYIHDAKRNLYICFNIAELKDSIANFKNIFNGNPNSTIEGANCTNKEALKRLNVIETIVDFITTNPNNIGIFDYLPYTKNGKFSKAGSITLFCSNITDTWSGEYFS